MRSEIVGRRIHGFSRSEIREFVDQTWKALRRARVTSGSWTDLTINFVDDHDMRELNREWRGRDRTTDILTFPSGDDESTPEGADRFLADLVISVDQARRQAREQRHDLATEIRYLLLHGMIHALGYDHETDRGEMDALEQRIRPRVGLS
jgi:probable rRNA maturation factor